MLCFCASVLLNYPLLPLPLRRHSFTLDYVDDYRTHTSCVTEAERYEKSLYKGQKNSNKKKIKLSPQQSWIQLVQKSADTAPYKVQHILKKIIDLGDNCPRKEKQFRNFVANSLSLRNGEDVITELWTYLQKCRTQEPGLKNGDKGEVEEDTKATYNPDSNVQVQPKGNQKNSEGKILEGMEATTLALNGKEMEPAKVIKAMKKVLKKSPGQKMKLKELRKQIKIQLELEKHSKQQLKDLIERQLAANSISRVRLEGKTVLLLSK
jgi:cell growth-regulating nucleolar protein